MCHYYTIIAKPPFTKPPFVNSRGYYNDHHLHYGYFVYSAAVLARFRLYYTYIYTHRYTYIYIYICIYVYVYIYIYTNVSISLSL